jgi:hypothetical protein
MITQTQLEQAYKLAEAHHHTWAHLDFGVVKNCTNVDEIRVLVHSNLSAGPAGWGIDAPTVNDEGNIVHETGTGRLAWEIMPCGQLTLTVARPNRVSVSLTLTADYTNHNICVYDPHHGTKCLMVEVLEPEPKAGGGEYTPVVVVWTNQEEGEEERAHTNLEWLGKPCINPGLPIHRRHVVALVQAYLSLGAPPNDHLELAFKALMSDVRPDGVIVSRHPAAIEFIRNRVDGAHLYPVLESATADDVRGQRMYGNLPLHLATMAESITAVEFSKTPPRGLEYTLEDMKAAGAYLRTYAVSGK